jgi:hypothetical protein
LEIDKGPVLYVVDVAPMMLLKLDPPFVDICHWTVGVGEPEDVAVKVAELPLPMTSLLGLRVIDGGKL